MAEGVRRHAASEEMPATPIEDRAERCRPALWVLARRTFAAPRGVAGKGADGPAQDDQGSVAMPVSGRKRMRIGAEGSGVGPGDLWRHPPSVWHESVALEDCVQIEIKAPPCRTWNL